jgi:hypothetical protein
MAWICWNPALLQQIHGEFIPAEDTQTLKPAAEAAELANFWNASCSSHVEYNLRFRRHAMQLGRFAETLDFCIDRFGFEDPRSREIGRAAFVQVSYCFYHCV